MIYLLSFFAGILTILAPCVLPLLPVIIGGSVADVKKRNPYIIILALAISMIVFTLLLRASTLLISIHPNIWKIISGGLIVILGVFTLFPHLWETIAIKLKFSNSSQQNLNEASNKKGFWGDVLLGAALGPVFTSCSPTYVLILAIVLPESFFTGFISIILYSAGLSLMMLLVSILGQKIVKKLKWAAKPNGLFKKIIGLLFILVGIAIIFGLDKKFEAFILNETNLYGAGELEEVLLDNFDLR